MSAPRAFVPQPRRRGVVSQEVDGELLLYVEETHQASSLNGPASQIWALCDGKRPVETIAAEARLVPDVVVAAVQQLAGAGLLENGAELNKVSLSRRTLIGVGLAAPVILMVIAPMAAAAATCVNGSCNPGQICCSNGQQCPIPGLECPP